MSSSASPERPLGQAKGQAKGFKKHRPLPRPRHPHRLDDDHRPGPVVQDLRPALDALSIQFDAPQSWTPRVLKHQSRTIATGPNLPPTPPNHSRNSSVSYPASSHLAESVIHRVAPDVRRPVLTPPDQRSPPTPDVTPPGPVHRPHALRHPVLESGLARTAVMGSPIDSFETAKEDPSSDDAISLTLPQPRSSASKLRIANSHRSPVVSPPELHVALERLQSRQTGASRSDARALARTGGARAASFDLERELGKVNNDAVAEHLDSAPHSGAAPPATNVARLTRQTRLNEPPLLSLDRVRSHHPRQPAPSPSQSDTSIHTDIKRLSGHSVKSSPSTVVGAILVDLPPQRQRTLRHVRKQGTLRDAVGSFSPVDDEGVSSLHHQSVLHDHDHRPLSFASNSSNSMASGRARQEVWDSGGIPVIVVPERRSSSRDRSIKERAPRPISGREPKKPKSSDPESRKEPAREDTLPEHQRRQRCDPPLCLSEHPTVAPHASTAKSAGVSADANGHTFGAVDYLLETFESPRQLKPHEQAQTANLSLEPQTSHLPETLSRFEPDEGHDLASFGRHEDALLSKKFSSRNTPFSIASDETTGTAHEVSEAMVVQMFLHQNSSVLVVDHMAKPAEPSDLTGEKPRRLMQPTIKTTSPDGGPVTPPQRDSLDEVDSPLRNPRRPPTPPVQPPVINFIPATPSGSTPAQERVVGLGNYFEVAAESPPRRPSIVRRALGRRRHSVDYPPTAIKATGLLTRTLSLSRGVRSAAASKIARADMDSCPRRNAVPADENKLHPFWRPQGPDEDACIASEGQNYEYEAGGVGPNWNQASSKWAEPTSMPKRSFSARMKRTFAIFPIRDDELFPAETNHMPERRTIRRTSSGNLRVMSRRASIDSHLRREGMRGATPAALHAHQRRRFWGGRDQGQDKRRLSAAGRRWEGIQKLPRILSERRREKRTQRLRQMISGPKDVRDGVREMIEPRSLRVSHRPDGHELT